MTKLAFDIETTGLNPFDSRITCICAKVIGGSAEFSEVDDKDESILIFKFLKFIRRENISYLVSANGKQFDLEFIFIRAFINKINIDDVYFLAGLEHFDVVNDITDKQISLNNLAKLYGFKQKTGDGLQAIRLFRDGEFDKLKEYCMHDVKLTTQIFLKYLENLEEASLMEDVVDD